MEILKALINFCILMLKINISLFGYHVSLFGVFIWGMSIFAVTWILFGIFK